MKNVRILALLCFPVFCNAQLVVKDTTIKGEVYHVYPYRMEIGYNYSDYEIFDLLDHIPQIPSVTDSLPSGRYVLLTPHEKKWDNKRAEYYLINNGKIKAEFSISNGVKNGLCKFYYRNKKLRCLGNYKDDVRDGIWDFFSYYTSYRLTYQNGILNGPAYKFRHKKLVLKMNFKDNERHGSYIHYYSNGQIEYYSNYLSKKDKQNEFRIDAVACDSMMSAYYSNGNIHFNYICKNGWRSLNYTTYFINGKVEEECKIIKYLESEDRYILETREYDEKTGNLITYEYSKSSTLEYSSDPISLLRIKYAAPGDTLLAQFGYEHDIDDSMYRYQLILTEKDYYNMKGNNPVKKETYYNAIVGNLEKLYNQHGRPLTSFDLKFSKDKSTYTITEFLYDTSGRFLVKKYATYRITEYNPTYQSIKNKEHENLVTGSDTIIFLYDNKPMNGSIYYPQEYRAKERCWGCYAYSYDFRLWNQQFAYGEITLKAFNSIYGGRKTLRSDSYNRYYRERDTIKFLMPVLEKDEYRLKKLDRYDNLYHINLIEGKIYGEFYYNNIVINFRNGIREGFWGERSKDYGYYRNGLKDGEFISHYKESYSNDIVKSNYTKDTMNGIQLIYEYGTLQPYRFCKYQMGKKVGSFLEIDVASRDTLFFANFVNDSLEGKLVKNTYKTILNLQNGYSNQSFIYELIKEYVFNFSHGYYKGKQYEYGKSGYLLRVMELDDSDLCTTSFEMNSYAHKVFNDGIFYNSNGRLACYYKSGIISEEGRIKQRSKSGIWKYYREDGSLYKQVDYTKIENPADLGIGEDTGYSYLGTISTYHLNGNIYEQGYVKSSKSSYDCNQERDIQDEFVAYASVQDSNGNYTFKNGSGKLTIYYTNGLLKAKGKQVNGLRDGFWIYFDPNGNPTEAGSYIKGEKDGRWLKGDLRGLHFIDNQCFSEDIDQELLKEKTEKNLSIDETIYKNGEKISSNSTRFERN